MTMSTSPTVPAAPTLTVGEVPGQPTSAQALRAWATDLAAGNMDVLVHKCWTIAPSRVRSMYADKAAIENAIARPGIEGQFAYIWQDDTTSVAVKRSEIASGYACPYVAARSDVHIFNSDDAKYRVLRFALRVVGKPVNADDTEAKYPLECSDWKPLSDSSRSIAATTTSIDRNSLVASGGPDDWQVTVNGTSNGGESRQYLYLTTVGPEGYCISEVR
ncbi:hypothetical protein [Smaragdicoccus niigatensis]|uniref:hypothetical protein n=1 Tax=Smaragdicoccus niigatensis TaxID=359359 RepID=UPI0012DBF2AC|nr:hypothetical protein [Smaragdicoccus niigatensis]